MEFLSSVLSISSTLGGCRYLLIIVSKDVPYSTRYSKHKQRLLILTFDMISTGFSALRRTSFSSTSILFKISYKRELFLNYSVFKNMKEQDLLFSGVDLTP
jgi:hypothetical protein